MSNNLKKGIAVLGGVILSGTIILVNQTPDGISPAGMVVDMPESNAQTITSRLQLLIAGGVYPRDIYVVVTPETHPDNLDAVRQHPNVVDVQIQSGDPQQLADALAKKLKNSPVIQTK